MRISVLLVVLLALLIPARPAGAAERQCFEQTGMCIEGRFFQFWKQNGGLAVFGYPITEAREELNRDTGKVYLTQWFERNRFELHPENAAPYDVLLGRLGDERLQQEGRDWRMVPREAGPKAGCLWFETTGHNVCDQVPGAGIRTYWLTNGLADPLLDSYGRSLALFGLPLTTAQLEVNDSGDYVMTQWFERARLEWHPDKPAEYRVLLGLLGSEALTDISATGWAPEVTMAGGRTFFAAGDGSHGMELWVSDGVGTRMLKDICLGACSAKPSWITAVGAQVFFMAHDGVSGEELWVTDGTTAGTRLVKDICPGLCASWPSMFTAFKGKLVFNAEGPLGREVWLSDGTSAGTTIIDIVPGGGSSYPGDFEQVGDTLYFGAYTTDHGLWRTDGTAAGTSLVKMMGGGTSVFWLTNAGGRLFFTSYAGNYGNELWVSDGTAAGTRLVKDIYPGPDSATPFGLTVLGSRVLFLAGLGETAGLWISDGTEAGTFQLSTKGYTTDIYPTTQGGLVYYTTGANDPNAPMYSTELWRSDGTVGGTYSLGVVNPRGVAEVGGGVVVADATCGLWRSNGTRAGTALIRQLAPQPCQLSHVDLASADGVAMIALDPDASRRELWRSDGTAAGTALVHTVQRVPWLAR